MKMSALIIHRRWRTAKVILVLMIGLLARQAYAQPERADAGNYDGRILPFYENQVRQSTVSVDIEHPPVTLGVLMEYGGPVPQPESRICFQSCRAGTPANQNGW